MATTKKKPTEVPPTRVAARPQSERRVEVSQSAATTGAPPSYEEVSRRAFEIWDRSGRAPGHDLEHWLQAESELRGA
jgi:hypothetical protein